MCGRYLLVVPSSLPPAQRLYFESLEKFGNSYNVAPGSWMPICRMVDGTPQLTSARWGLVPHWAEDEKIGLETINAAAETVASNPTYKDAYRSRRCLVAASGYYESAATPEGKQPYYFTSEDGRLLPFAGLWETWTPKEGDPVTTFTIIVCAATS